MSLWSGRRAEGIDEYVFEQSRQTRHRPPARGYRVAEQQGAGRNGTAAGFRRTNDQNNKRRKCTDNDRVDKRFESRDYSFTYGFVGFRR